MSDGEAIDVQELSRENQNLRGHSQLSLVEGDVLVLFSGSSDTVEGWIR